MQRSHAAGSSKCCWVYNKFHSLVTGFVIYNLSENYTIFRNKKTVFIRNLITQYPCSKKRYSVKIHIFFCFFKRGNTDVDFKIFRENSTDPGWPAGYTKGHWKLLR